jgi:hypothetical protein
MRNLLLLTTLLFTFISFADEVKIEITPPKPVMGEPFQAFFRIFTDSSDEPVINFSPVGLEVVGKNNHGTSVRTVYSNGTLTSTREVTYVYDLVASKSGFVTMRDINVDIGTKTIRHPAVTVNILKEAEEAKDVFLAAEVPKKSLYLGEGFVVRYFLYTKVQINNPDVKRYPKLNSFLKRFLQEPERSERVSVDGQVYVRHQIYAAKLFPEKVGTLKVDPLTLSVAYAATRGNDPFSNFGFSRDFKQKTLNSESLNIEVKPLPEMGKPQNFTGLVGKHEFNLDMGQARLIVNEPLEVKLTITGGGALENMEAPVIIKHPGLEEFESNGDLKIQDAESATKVFDYTFLAKENLKLPAQTISMNYYDPDSEKYVSIPLNVSEVVVAGGSAEKKKDELKEDPKQENKSVANTVKKIQDFAAPVMIDATGWRSWISTINLSLAILALLIALGWVIKFKTFPKWGSSQQIPSVFRKNDFNRVEFTRWISPLIQISGKSPSSIIKAAELSEETKKYFSDLLNANDHKDYSTKKTDQKYVYEAKHFKELGQYMQKVTHEDSEHIARHT